MTMLLMQLLIPALAAAHINIRLEGNWDNLQVHYSGESVDVISDTEVDTFQVNDNNIKNAVDRYFGARPDDAYLRSPTPWGDLYQRYNGGQVKRTMRPISGSVVSINHQPQIVVKHIAENKYSQAVIFKFNISQSVENSVTSSWNKGGEFTIGQEVSYKFLTAKLGFTNQWGENHGETTSVTLGPTSGISVKLLPGEKVEATLQATRGTAEIEVQYEAFLSGSVIVYYNETYKGHHFWALDINEVMNAGGINNRIISKETITVDYYSDARVVLKHLN